MLKIKLYYTLTLILLLGFFLHSCKAIIIEVAKPIIGFKNVKIIPTSKVHSFAMKNHIDMYNVAFLKPLELVNKRDTLNLKNIDNDIKVYDGKGYKIQITSGACTSINPANFLDTSETFGFKLSKLDSSQSIMNQLKYFEFRNTYNLSDTVKKYDLILLVPFSTWLYGPSKKMSNRLRIFKKNLNLRK